MANHQKDIKKVATKAPKVHGSPKVPKYEQRESSLFVDLPKKK